MLSPTTPEDLPMLFRFQAEAEARHMAAFVSGDPADEAAFLAKYRPFLSDPTINMQTIRVEGVIAGSISKFVMHGDAEITYWLGQAFWGRGLATRALRAFLELEPARPLYGRTAFDNLASRRVLTACGFVETGRDAGFAAARNANVEEIIFRLEM